ncbi:MAG: 2-hydroxyacyl-CoA dehydratase, partial [Novosphingobium sp.]
MTGGLRRACANPEGEVERALAEGRRPIRTLGYDAPRARLIAAGFQPVRLVAPRLEATPRADAIMGAAEMGPRGRRLLEALLDPAHPEVPVLITQADADQPQIFAALRELGRLGEAVPRHVHFCDLLHIDRPASAAYNDTRLGQLHDWLAGLGGSAVNAGSLAASGGKLERIDHLLARLEVLYPASQHLELVAGSAILPVDESLAALEAALAAQPAADAASGLRVFLCGTAHEGAELYRAIEEAGASIVGAEHGWARLHGAPARIASPFAVAEGIAQRVRDISPDLVLHLAIDGDEAAPWDIAAIRAALPEGQRFAALRCGSIPDDAVRACIAAALSGDEVQPPSGPPPAPPSKPKPRAEQGRSRKSLTSTADVNAYQRDWFARVRQEVAAGSPFAVVNANAPQEILRAMDVPFVVNQWWASIVAAKQQSRRYQGLLRERDYPADVEAYSAQGLAALFDDDAENAPWGGLPRPDFVHAVASSDPTFKLFEQWGDEAGADCFVYERTVDPRPDLYSDWWDRLPGDWENAVETER